MKVSYNWLKDWVDIDLDAPALAEALTMAGLEVDSVAPASPPLDGVVVAEVVEAKQHPNADRLRVCTVDYGGSETANIVCGAPNARVGLKAPLATLGAVLPGGMKIKPAKLRGVASEGMLCSAIELELGAEADGLMELPADAPIGQALTEYLGLDDWIIDVDLTPNRGDCLSIRGLARDIAAIVGAPLRAPQIAPTPPQNQRTFEVELCSPEDCARYVGRVIENVDTSVPTPQWMVQRLERCGIRSLGPVVDVTNYVLLELGQPLHAFDLDKLKGGIRVRRGREGDRLKLLDERDITPDESQLLITDHAGPVALAGVMGGADSAVGEGTANVFLESAWFNPAVIVGKARALGMSTESAHRFERGVDPDLQTLAAERATMLLMEIAGGVPGPVVDVVDSAHLPQVPTIELRLARVNALLGSALDSGAVKRILESLGMKVTGDGAVFQVRPPSARVDIALEVDLIEEVARIHGFNQLPEAPPGGRLDGKVPGERILPEARLREHLVARGFNQAIGWSFVSQALLQRFGLDQGCQPLANPISQDMGVLRTALTPGLVQVAANNLRRQHTRVRLFETGHCFVNATDGAFNEPQRIALLMAGDADPEHWDGNGRAVDFFDLKGEVQALLSISGGEAEFRPAGHSWLHPGQRAEITRNGRTLGWLGQLHPALAVEFDITGPVFVAEIALDDLRERPIPEYRIASRFPAVRRDLSLLVPEATPAGEVVSAARELAGTRLKEVVVFDQYRGEGVEKGYKSLAIGLIFRDLSRTLTDQEIDKQVSRLTTGLENSLGTKLRG